MTYLNYDCIETVSDYLCLNDRFSLAESGLMGQSYCIKIMRERSRFPIRFIRVGSDNRYKVSFNEVHRYNSDEEILNDFSRNFKTAINNTSLNLYDDEDLLKEKCLGQSVNAIIDAFEKNCRKYKFITNDKLNKFDVCFAFMI